MQKPDSPVGPVCFVPIDPMITLPLYIANENDFIHRNGGKWRDRPAPFIQEGPRAGDVGMIRDENVTGCGRNGRDAGDRSAAAFGKPGAMRAGLQPGSPL